MKQKHVGVFRLGHEQVDVYLREGNGGEFYTCPEDGRLPRIKVGAGDSWKNVVTAAHHEAMEFCMMRLECRFVPSGEYCGDHSSYLFAMNHPQFSEASARTSWFLADCLPVLSTAYRKWSAKPKRKRHNNLVKKTKS